MRSTVVLDGPLLSFTVSLSGRAGTAPIPVRAVWITASTTARSTKGLAASWTSTISHAGDRASSPAATEALRSAPPGTRTRAAGERLEPGWRIGGVLRGQRYHDLGNFGMGSERTEGAQQHRDAGDLAILLGDLAAQPFAASCGYDDDANVTRQALAPVVRRDPVRRSRIQGSGRRFVLR